MKKILFALLILASQKNFAQNFLQSSKKANHWVDSVFNALTPQQRIAQLIIIRAHSDSGMQHIERVTSLIKKYNVGGLCFFQGGPHRQANLTNQYQQLSKTPLLITTDAEWGLGMRLDSVIQFPKNLMLGALQNNPQLVFKVGNAIGKQCKRLGVHVNYAPVVDVNNNPNNPVINDRSFGEDAKAVSSFAFQYLKGLQQAGVMGCAKHFPGHGDVAVDSHLDLPIINKSMPQLQALELLPYKNLLQQNLAMIMTAHLSIPAIDTTKNLPTSLSNKAVAGLLKQKFNYKSLVITDALEMKGVTKYFPAGNASLQALIAGNDLLCLPMDTDSAIAKIESKINSSKAFKAQVYASVKKVLLAKYNLGLYKKQWIDTTNLTNDLNNGSFELIKDIAENAITIVKQTNKKVLNIGSITQPYDVLPRVAYIDIGTNNESVFAKLMKQDWNADVYKFNNVYAINDTIEKTIEPFKGVVVHDTEEKINAANAIIDSCIKLNKYHIIIIGNHHYNRRPANNFGIANSAYYLMNELGKQDNSLLIFFGNPYAINKVCDAKNIIAAYQSDDIIQKAVAEFLQGKFAAKGKLPVSVCK